MRSVSSGTARHQLKQLPRDCAAGKNRHAAGLALGRLAKSCNEIVLSQRPEYDPRKPTHAAASESEHRSQQPRKAPMFILSGALIKKLHESVG
jgi:hypothetical protein